MFSPFYFSLWKNGFRFINQTNYYIKYRLNLLFGFVGPYIIQTYPPRLVVPRTTWSFNKRKLSKGPHVFLTIFQQHDLRMAPYKYCCWNIYISCLNFSHSLSRKIYFQSWEYNTKTKVLHYSGLDVPHPNPLRTLSSFLLTRLLAG